MMVKFDDRFFSYYAANPDVGFNELSMYIKENYGENIFLAQFCLLKGLGQYAKEYDIPITSVDGLLFSLAESTRAPSDYKPGVEQVATPCGSCGGGEVR